MSYAKVLVLNSTYEPLTLASVKAILKRIYSDKSPFEIEKYSAEKIKTGSAELPIPSVVRLKTYVNTSKFKIKKASKRHLILVRDNYCCQFCGKALTSSEATLDHFVPKSSGGETKPHNLVTACKTCNNQKSDKAMSITETRLSKSLLFCDLDRYILTLYARKYPEWSQYLCLE